MTTISEALYTTPDASKSIDTKQQLFSHLYDAARVEMQSIPMYLYAAYSIKTQNSSQWAPGPGAFRLIKSVVIEEMLHLALVRNMIVAIGCGDRVHFSDPDFLPSYPQKMLHRSPEDPLMLHLAPITPKLVRDVFMKFEQPARKGAPPESENYHSLAQFYRAIHDGFFRVAGCRSHGKGRWSCKAEKVRALFNNSHPELQYVEAYWNEGGGGTPIVVHDLKTAATAINMIVEQGEGMDADKKLVPTHPEKPRPGEFEQPHYIKFKRIADEWEPIGHVHPVPTDPRAAKFPEGPVRDLGTLFNAAYTYTMRVLDEIYRTSWSDVHPGATSPRYGLERQFIAVMQGLLFGVARELTRTSITSGEYSGKNAAPTFEFYEFPADEDMTAHLRGLCEDVVGDFPRLGGDNGVLWLTGKLMENMPEMKPFPKLPPRPDTTPTAAGS